MDRKTISSLGIVLLVGLTLTGCAGYYSGYGHYDYPYLGYYDYPYYDYGNRYYGYPYDRHERGNTIVSLANTEENGADLLCIGRWGLLLDFKSIMPPLLDTLNIVDL